MAKKPVKLQLDDDPPRVVNGKWLRVLDRECDDQSVFLRLDQIVAIHTLESGCRIDAPNDTMVWVANYSADQLLKVIMDAEFQGALEQTLTKGI